MNKTLLSSAIALALGSASSAQAATITITEMAFLGTHAASGTMNDAGNGSMTDTSIGGFFGHAWTADQQVWFDTHSSPISWAGTGTSNNTGNAYANFSYTAHLTGNQVAAGVFFDWNGNHNIPVFTVYTCGETGPSACAGVSQPMQTPPFAGQSPGFNGSTADDFPVSNAVPVPAAVWLMGSGLLGLVGVARRRRKVA